MCRSQDTSNVRFHSRPDFVTKTFTKLLSRAKHSKSETLLFEVLLWLFHIMLDVDESFRANCSFAGVVSQSHDDAEDEDKRKRQQNAKERAARQFKDGVLWSGNKATPSLFHSLLDTVSSNAVNTDSVYFKGIAEVVCMIILCVANDLTSDPENESR